MISADGTVIGYTRHGDELRQPGPLANAITGTKPGTPETGPSASDGGGSPRNSILVDMLRR